MGDNTSVDLIDLSSIEQLTTLNNASASLLLNNNNNNNSVDNTTASDHSSSTNLVNQSCDSIKQNSPINHHLFKINQNAQNNDNNQQQQLIIIDDFINDGSHSRRTKERIDEFEAQLECFIKTKRLLLEQFEEETQNLAKKYDNHIMTLRRRHFICENTFKSQLQNLEQKIKNLEEKLKTEQNSLKLKVEFYEEELRKHRQDSKSNIERLEMTLNEKEKLNDELEKKRLSLESQLKLKTTEYHNRRQELDQKLHEYETNQEKDRQELRKLREELNYSLKEISALQLNLADVKEALKNKENQCIALEKEIQSYKSQIQIEAEYKKESADRIQVLRETLKVSQNENDTLQQKLSETQTIMGEEIEKLKNKLATQQSSYEQRFRRSIEEKTEMEEKFNSEIKALEKRLQDSVKQCDHLNEELQKILADRQKLKHQHDSQIDKLKSDKQGLEQSYNARLDDLSKKLSDLEQRLKTMTEKYESAQDELAKSQGYMNGLENDLKTKNSEILNVHEKYNLLEMDRLSLLSEMENIKRLLHLETVEKKEKTRQIDELNETLSSSQIEIEKLKSVNEQLKRSLEDGDNLRFSLLKDCNELRETLTEVEKSRLDIKSKLNTCQFNCASLNNQIKKRDLETEDLKRKLNSYSEEKKFWQQDLDSTSQSLTQMKTAYERLYQQNVLLQNKLSQLESESNTRINDAKNSPVDKETLKRLSRECEQSRERIAKLESEKRHFERLYINTEREYNNLKNTFNSNINARSPSPAQTAHKFSDHSSSVLQLSQLLGQTQMDNLDPFALDDFSNQRLENLKKKNKELQQKVLERNHSKSTNHHLETGSAKRISSSDICECLYTHHLNHNNGQTENEIYGGHAETIDENKNNIITNIADFVINDDNSFDEKLKQAELNAQKVLDSCQPEIQKLSKTSRIKTAHHHKSHNHQQPITSK